MRNGEDVGEGRVVGAKAVGDMNSTHKKAHTHKRKSSVRIKETRDMQNNIIFYIYTSRENENDEHIRTYQPICYGWMREAFVMTQNGNNGQMCVP